VDFIGNTQDNKGLKTTRRLDLGLNKIGVRAEVRVVGG